MLVSFADGLKAQDRNDGSGACSQEEGTWLRRFPRSVLEEHGSSNVGTRHRPFTNREISLGFRRRTNILSTRTLQGVNRRLCPIWIVAMHREQNPAPGNTASKSFGFVFGNGETRQRSCYCSEKHAKT